MEQEKHHQPPHRPSPRHNINRNWKDKLRENCYERVRDGRMRLLWKTRLQNDPFLNDKEFIKSAFQDIVSDEIKKLRDLISTADANDILWEYDGFHAVPEGECEDIMLEMQKVFYEDQRTEPLRREPEASIGTWEDEEDEYLARLTFEHMQLNEVKKHKEIWCPICKQGQLLEDQQRICCNLCELHLSKGDEVNLELLRVRLAEAHMDHLDRGCKLKPKFCIETRFGLTALYIFCRECSTFEVVI